MTDREQAGASLRKGVWLVRHGRAEEAIPYLEVAEKDAQLKFAPAALRAARAIASGIDTVEVVLNDCSFHFVLESGNFGLDLHHVDGRFFETEELLYCSQVVPHRSVVVDVGANTGNHLVFFIRFLKPRLAIPIEPVPQAIDVLRRNLQLNAMSVDMRGLGLAAGRETGRLSLKADEGSDLVVASVQERAVDDTAPAVACVRLDDLIEERVDFLKIDVEGFEDNVLLGADRILSQDKPLLMLEMNDDKQSALLAQISRYGYKSVKEFQGFNYKNVFCRVQ